MNLTKLSFQSLVGVVGTVAVLGLTGCEQTFGVGKTTSVSSDGSSSAGTSNTSNTAGSENGGGSSTNGGSSTGTNGGSSNGGSTSNGGSPTNGNSPTNGGAGNGGSSTGVTPNGGTGSGANGGNGAGGSVTIGSPTPRAPVSATSSENFSVTSSTIKKIDFLFVVDNSPSMDENQLKLAQGFEAFANTFFRRTDLDICTQIITSDRYLGRTGKKGYKRERSLACTKPAGSETWTPVQMKNHIDSLITEFEDAVQVGVNGSPTELLGKSLVAYLQGVNEYGENPNNSQKASFFRKDAVANISFLTDENNYFYTDPKIAEWENDLPYTSGIQIPGAKSGTLDNRKGIKQYTDEYFTSLTPGHAPNYSVTSILQLARPDNSIPGISVNLNALVGAVGRESTRSDMTGPSQSYTDVYQNISDGIVTRASEFTLAHAVQSNLVVKLVKQGGSSQVLSVNADYVVRSNNELQLTDSLLARVQDGDQLQVTYTYLE